VGRETGQLLKSQTVGRKGASFVAVI